MQTAVWPELAAGREVEVQAGEGSSQLLKPWLLCFLGCRGLKGDTEQACVWGRGERGLLRHRASSLHTCIVTGCHLSEQSCQLQPGSAPEWASICVCAVQQLCLAQSLGPSSSRAFISMAAVSRAACSLTPTPASLCRTELAVSKEPQRLLATLVVALALPVGHSGAVLFSAVLPAVLGICRHCWTRGGGAGAICPGSYSWSTSHLCPCSLLGEMLS